MKKRCVLAVAGFLLIWPLFAAAQPLSPDEIMDRLENRYNVDGIYVRFLQSSTLKALDVTDTAEGEIYIKQPGRMRWEYETPEKQLIITDGTSFWIYRPDDNQVITGAAAAFFGDGKGGAFLSDISTIRDHFTIELISEEPPGVYEVELTPKTSSGGLSTVHLHILRESFSIIQVITENAYGDETRLTFEPPEFDRQLPDELFSFSPPNGAEIVSWDE
jgi:outer membrane lipoprotein carrier protein